MIIILPRIHNGFTLKWIILESIQHTNSISSTWLNQKVLTTKVWNLWYTLKEMLNRVKVKVLDGIEMDKIFAISKILLKRRQVVFIIHSLFKYNSQMIMTRYILHIATHIHIQIARNCFRNFASLNLKTGYEKPSYVKQ